MSVYAYIAFLLLTHHLNYGVVWSNQSVPEMGFRLNQAPTDRLGPWIMDHDGPYIFQALFDEKSAKPAPDDDYDLWGLSSFIDCFIWYKK